MEHSTEIAEEMLKLYPDEAQVIEIEMKYDDEVKEYLQRIERAHRDAENSTLCFP